ncbi:MAG: DNA-binding transcriptional regulator [Spirochaetales bacterium]|nr:DNA-binding transcriptional regulator [Spirochaetales bacterium]
MNIALCMGINDYYEHGIARGVVRFAKEKGWNLSGYGWMFGRLDDITGWDGDGIITRIESSTDADLFAGLGKPVVDVAGAYSRSAFCQVNNDDYLTGRKAGLHLKERGFSNYAFCGVEKVGWSKKRRMGFADATGAEEIPVFERSLEWWEELDRSESLNEWLLTLPQPGAVFACNDTAGVKLTSVCRQLGISVPAGLAILGVDNEDILCELAEPALSSVQLDCEQIGYRAAELLESLLTRRSHGQTYTSEILVRPKGIAERESTRIFVSPDPLIREAVNYIRTSARRGLGVREVAEYLNVSRRTLEMRFRRVLGRSIHEEIILSRLGFAEKRLISSNITVEAVALEAGFGSIQRFHAGFKEKNGMTPGEFRNRGRRG